MNKEIWKDIPNYEGLYQISNLGNVKNIKTNICKSKNISNSGYYYVDLYKNNNRAKKNIHRLVAETFILNKNNYSDVNHIDGNKLNNCVNNLEWCTRSYNLKEAYRLKLRKPVKLKENKNPNSKIIIQYDKNGNFIKKWYSITKASEETGIYHTQIRRCCNKYKNYKTAGGFIWKFEGE